MANFITGFLNRLLNPHLNGEHYTNAAADALLGLSSSGQSQYDTSLQTNIQEAEKNRLFQRQMVQEEREYNTPAAQMARARAAGLNPSLLYGQPISEAGSAPAGSEASVGMGSTGDLSRLITSAPSMLAQIDLMRAQAAEIRSRIPLNEQKTSNLRASMDDILASIQQRYADIQLKYSQSNLNDATRENISFEQMLKQGQLSIDYQRLQNENDLTAANVQKLQAETKSLLARASVSERELQEMIWTYAVRAQGLEKQNLLTDAQIAQANATADKLKKEGVRVEQLTAIDAPQALNAQSWADDMAGKNGAINQVGASITYQIVDGIKQIGGILLK